MQQRFDIGIIGLGIAGSAVAGRLARAGHRVVVLERAPRISPVGAGILLQPSGQAILHRWGLLDDLAPRCEPIEALHAVHPSGRTLVRIPYALTGTNCHGLGVHRADLFELLYREAVASGAEVRLNQHVAERVVGDRGIVVRDTEREEHGPFDFLIAADGAHSHSRRTFGRVRIDHEYRFGALWAVGDHPELHGELRQTVRGTRQLIGLLPTGGGRCSFFASLRSDEREAVVARGFDPWRDAILATCPSAAPIVERLGGWDDLVFTTYRAVVMKSMFDRSTLFLGDAAHATSPHLGQGVNLALIDADEFATSLEECGEFAAACRRFARRRRTQLRYYAAMTAALTPFFQSSGVARAKLRDLVLPWLPRLPWVGRQMALAMAGVKTDWFRSDRPFDR